MLILRRLQQCHALSLRLLGYFALSLDLPDDFFTALHPATLDRLRLLHYPPFEPSTEEQDVRTGAHSDYGSLTLLFQKEVGGLEVLVPKKPDALSTDVEGGEWVAAPIVEGAIIVNIGDAMVRPPYASPVVSLSA
jgi:isopenicillin N synthase-like dioxygenase